MSLEQSLHVLAKIEGEIKKKEDIQYILVTLSKEDSDKKNPDLPEDEEEYTMNISAKVNDLNGLRGMAHAFTEYLEAAEQEIGGELDDDDEEGFEDDDE